jgi:hypothetical protein
MRWRVLVGRRAPGHSTFSAGGVFEPGETHRIVEAVEDRAARRAIGLVNHMPLFFQSNATS